MARMSIYVPDDFKLRMDPLNDRVNWSSIAQEAFEMTIRRYPNRSENDMSAIVERLRASKDRNTKDRQQQGRAAGRNWAEHMAEFDDLKSLGEAELENWAAEDMPIWIITKHLKLDGDASEFWESIVGENWKLVVNSYFAMGFYEGAKAVWEEVESQI